MYFWIYYLQITRRFLNHFRTALRSEQRISRRIAKLPFAMIGEEIDELKAMPEAEALARIEVDEQNFLKSKRLLESSCDQTAPLQGLDEDREEEMGDASDVIELMESDEIPPIAEPVEPTSAPEGTSEFSLKVDSTVAAACAVCFWPRSVLHCDIVGCLSITAMTQLLIGAGLCLKCWQHRGVHEC